MTKNEAVEKFVQERLSSIPTEWVQIVAENKGAFYDRFPMWGTMWFIDAIWGEELIKNARTMQDYDETKSQEWNEENADEEMTNQACVLDKDGNTTNIFIYEIDGEYLIGIHGAGFNFYDGVWNKLYDRLGLEWHNKN